ncbi:hypothetical protein [Singulisphaera sp. PoT]|uniref:hypothetical protein n=1 Tax=Singulisphaera sp. PoT TaxID=3411797 RepID=UPI003BF46CFA
MNVPDFDFDEYLAELGCDLSDAEEKPPTFPTTIASLPTLGGDHRHDVHRYGEVAADRLVADFESDQCSDGRNNAFNRACDRLGRIESGTGIAGTRWLEQLSHIAIAKGLGQSEVAATARSGYESGLNKPIDVSHVGRRAVNPGSARQKGGDSRAEDDSKSWDHLDNPQRMAMAFLGSKFRLFGDNTLVWFQDDYYRWVSGSYQRIPASSLKTILATFCRDEFERFLSDELMRWGMRNSGNPDGEAGDNEKPKLKKLTKSFVADVMQSLDTLIAVDTLACPGGFGWIGKGEAPDWSLDDIMVASNAIVNIKLYLEGRPCTMAPTPRLFATNALSYPWDAAAPPPTRWLRLMNEIWGDDTESIECLQQWFGYNLTRITKYQKFMFMFGASR